MSESVRFFLESRVPELEDLFKKGLFSKDEIKEVVAKRNKFEHKLKRRGAILEDFLAYIKYETELEQTRKQRYEMLNIRAKHSISDHSIVKYILSLYRRAVTKFRGNMPLWDQYINYARESKSHKSMPKILASALQMHPESVDIWIKSATWELNHLNNPASARALFLRGIRMNKESKSLWFEYFRMELEVANSFSLAEKKLELSEKKLEESNEITVFDGAIAISVFKFASKECLLKIEEAYEYYHLSLNYENLSTVSNYIKTFILESMPNQYIFHVLKARSEVLLIDLDNENYISSFEKCMSSLNEALGCGILTSIILSDVFEVLRSVFEKSIGHKEIQAMVFDKLNRILEAGEKSDALTAEIYNSWIKICHEGQCSESFIKELIQRAAIKFPRNYHLLEKKVNFISNSEDADFSFLTSSFVNIVKSSPKTCVDSLDEFFKKYFDCQDKNLLELALISCKNYIPSSHAINYVLKYTSEGTLLDSFDHLKITPGFVATLINALLDKNLSTEIVKKFVCKFSIFSSQAFDTKDSALALVRFSMTISDIELCNRLYAKSISALPPSSIESFIRSFELLKESTLVLAF